VAASGERDVATALCRRVFAIASTQRGDYKSSSASLTTEWPLAIREQIRARRDDGASAGVALGFVEVFAVVRR
jgi:hypothetical protein